MTNTTADLDSHPNTAAHPAYFDFTVVSASGFDGTPDRSPLNLLTRGLRDLGKRTALLDCAHSGASARPVILHEVIAPDVQFGEPYTHRSPDKVFYAAAKLLCLDDQLFNLEDGGDFVRMSVSTARRAGRMTALLCTDLHTAFSKRQEIVDCFGGVLDCVVGKPREVLSLFGLSRIDSLVPKLIHLGTGLVLYRVDKPSISIRPKSGVAEFDDGKISSEAFWSQFVPAAFDDFLVPVAS